MGDYYVLVAKENETIGQMAKELDRGCSPEELIEFNAKNLPCLTSKSKFRTGCEVRLPTLSCAYYLADARVAKAETEAEARVGDAHREMEVAKAEAANAKAEAANAKAEAANAKAEAAAAKAEAKALKGASENLRDLFLKNMSERAGKMFKEDLAGLGPVRLREVDEAQAAVVVMAKDLAAQGQITLQEGREDEMVY